MEEIFKKYPNILNILTEIKEKCAFNDECDKNCPFIRYSEEECGYFCPFASFLPCDWEF